MVLIKTLLFQIMIVFKKTVFFRNQIGQHLSEEIFGIDKLPEDMVFIVRKHPSPR